MPLTNGTTHKPIDQQISDLQQFWQRTGTAALTPTSAAPTPAGTSAADDPIGQLSTFWHGPDGNGGSNLNTASAGPTPPAASDAATAALIAKLKAQNGGS